jgi:hypothetical protein
MTVKLASHISLIAYVTALVLTSLQATVTLPMLADSGLTFAALI